MKAWRETTHATSVALISDGIAQIEQIHCPLTKWVLRNEVIWIFGRWQHCHKYLLCIMASCTRKTTNEEQYSSPSSPCNCPYIMSCFTKHLLLVTSETIKLGPVGWGERHKTRKFLFRGHWRTNARNASAKLIFRACLLLTHSKLYPTTIQPFHCR